MCFDELLPLQRELVDLHKVQRFENLRHERISCWSSVVVLFIYKGEKMESNSWKYMCDYLEGRIDQALMRTSEDKQTEIMCAYVERGLVGKIQGIQYHVSEF
jgi:hypothetical protein